jgi:hypothetical protein
MKSTGQNNNNKRVMIYHCVLNLEYEYNTTYFLITEMVGDKPLRTYSYKIPNNYKDESLLGELDEKFAPYCPN